MTALHVVVAINPSASFGKGRAVGPAVVQALRGAGHRVTALSEPTFADLYREADKAIALNPDALVVVGGDGMVSLGTNLVAGTSLPLGIVPSGTGNDVARGLHIPIGNTDAAIDLLLAAMTREPRVIDAAIIRRAGAPDRWYAGVLSAGFDARVNERANRWRWPRGKSRYNLALLCELATLTPTPYRLVLDGVEWNTAGTLVSIANNTSFGAGMLITPDALLDDGFLDVFVVQPLSRTAFLVIFPRVFSGTHVTDPRVSIRRAKHVTIEADGVVAYADGERVGPLPVEVEIVPGALRILAP
ncbi:diacylglycerol kinase family protein [Frigoribacterium sp. CG_9.8]|uniref:diacylglycerol kinase family protein n=1 Tax=Frigoribacterium sp. CG_9.8 TaxID=2787733 RepID=UPI0018CB2A5E|nr:diacylglycerol kinase (ATP) [Frigoribacterium sp. CG_9.8]